MGKAMLNANVEERAKDAIAEAVTPILGEQGSMTKLVEKIGISLEAEMRELKESHGDILPPCDLRIQMIPR